VPQDAAEGVDQVRSRPGPKDATALVSPFGKPPASASGQPSIGYITIHPSRTSCPTSPPEGRKAPQTECTPMTPDRTPDALFLPETLKRGGRMIDRVASIADIAEPLLGVDRTRGERAYIRLQGNGKLFITKSVTDTIYFPKGHVREGQPRYRWELQPDGAEFGYLVEGATNAG
jgi:hypothetical protein